MATERSLAVGGQAIALTPQDVVANATVQAKLLMDIVEKTRCFTILLSRMKARLSRTIS